MSLSFFPSLCDTSLDAIPQNVPFELGKDGQHPGKREAAAGITDGPEYKERAEDRRTWPDRKPDLRKLVRSTEDALSDAGRLRNHKIPGATQHDWTWVAVAKRNDNCVPMFPARLLLFVTSGRRSGIGVLFRGRNARFQTSGV